MNCYDLHEDVREIRVGHYVYESAFKDEIEDFLWNIEHGYAGALLFCRSYVNERTYLSPRTHVSFPLVNYNLSGVIVSSKRTLNNNLYYLVSLTKEPDYDTELQPLYDSALRDSVQPFEIYLALWRSFLEAAQLNNVDGALPDYYMIRRQWYKSRTFKNFRKTKENIIS